MSGIFGRGVESYLYSLAPQRDEILREMEARADREDIPIVGPLVGHFFSQLAAMARIKTVFEMGSAIGYSTLWWARAVGPEGRVIYTDSDPQNAHDAQEYLLRAGVAERVHVEIGDALEILARQPRSFDLLFNDVDKEEYPKVFHMAARHVKRGGLFVTDNVLWSAKVVAPAEQQDAATHAIAEFNRLQANAKDWITTIVPLRDGVSVSLRI